MANKLDNAIILEAAEVQVPPAFAVGQGAILWGNASGAGRCAIFSGTEDPINGDPAWAAAGLAAGGSAMYLKQNAVSQSTVLWVTANGGTTWGAITVP